MKTLGWILLLAAAGVCRCVARCPLWISRQCAAAADWLEGRADDLVTEDRR